MSEDTYCRLCAMKIENCIKIYDEEGEKLNLATKIIQCLQIWLYPEDVLPKTICEECCTKVNDFFDFFQTCSQSQISLMTMLKDKDYDDKVLPVINNIEEISTENNLTAVYEDDNDNTDRTEEEEECSEYTDLSAPLNQEKSKSTEVSQKNTETIDSLEKSGKLPSDKHQLPEDNENTTSSQMGSGKVQIYNQPQLPGPLQVRKRERKCKNTAKQSPEDDEDYESEVLCEEEGDSELEDGPKLTGKGLEGYVWKCTECTEELKTVGELRRHHETVHSQPPVFACMDCNKTYIRYRSFSRHAKSHTNQNKFCCEVCGKCFSQKTVLQSHAAVHSEERPHSCTTCGKSFKQFSSLYLHSKCHLPPDAKPKFQCNICAKEFSAKHSLETHLKLHTGERNFVCDICGRRFIAKGSLDYHIMTHNDFKPYTCEVCGKGFKTERLLAKHSTLHTGVKPHQCDVCGKQFRERGALREHNRIHTGVMPYSCGYCGKLFRFKGILTVHIRQHTGERPYSCSECRRDFTNWANYNKHMKRRHSRQADSTPSTVTAPTQAVPSGLNQQYEVVEPAFKTVDEDLYRSVPNYVPNIGYYIPPMQHTIALQSRQ